MSTNYNEIGVNGEPSILVRLLHKLIPGAPFERPSSRKARLSETPVIDPRTNDSVMVERRTVCEHGEWDQVEASLSRVWCNKCWDMVDVEFRELY